MRVVSNQGCCVFIQYNLLKGCCEWILIQPWTQVIDFSLPGLTWHTGLRIGISHRSISGIVVHGRCYISHCFYFSICFYFPVIFYDSLLVHLCFLFLFSCLLTVVWATKNPHIIIFIMVLVHYIILLNCNIVDYFILLCHDYLFSIVFIILFLFSFLFFY